MHAPDDPAAFAFWILLALFSYASALATCFHLLRRVIREARSPEGENETSYCGLGWLQSLGIASCVTVGWFALVFAWYAYFSAS